MVARRCLETIFFLLIWYGRVQALPSPEADARDEPYLDVDTRTIIIRNGRDLSKPIISPQRQKRDGDDENRRNVKIKQTLTLNKPSIEKTETQPEQEAEVSAPAVMTVVMKFPKNIRQPRALDNRIIGLVEKGSLEIINEALAGTAYRIKVGTPVVLHTPDDEPYSSTPIYFQDSIRREALEELPEKIKEKLAASAGKLNWSVESISTVLGGRIGQTCSKTEDCITRGGVCKEGKCRCGSRYVQTGDDCIPDGGIGAPCQKIYECTVPNSRCLDTVCACTHYHHVEGQSCVEDDILGGQCINVHQCDSFSMDCRNNTCVCKEAFIEHEGLCLLKTNHGTVCSQSGQCSHTQFCSTDGLCECMVGTQFISIVGCTTVKPYGSACLVKEECFGIGMGCIGAVCKCQEDLALSALENNTCIRAIVRISYTFVFNELYTEALYGDSASVSYQAKAAIVQQIVINANIPGFVSVESVILREGNNSNLEALATFTIHNPDAVTVPERGMRRKSSDLFQEEEEKLEVMHETSQLNNRRLSKRRIREKKPEHQRRLRALTKFPINDHGTENLLDIYHLQSIKGSFVNDDGDK